LDAIAKDYKRFIRQTSRRYYKRIHVWMLSCVLCFFTFLLHLK
jgi:hypothetical protein